MNARDERPVLLAAGGTGGHMFPAEALARELLARGRAVALVTDRRGKAFGDALPEVPVHRIRAASPSGGLLGKAAAVVELGLGALQARALLGRLRPAAVVGFGGYPSVPAVMAAQRAGIPTVLHEQNAVLGRANRMLAGRARAICTSFPEVGAVRPADADRLVPTGNPVRPAVAALRDLPYPAPEPGGPIAVLVTGGSQGARVFSEVVPAAIALLAPGERARLRLVQQARAEDLEAARAAYAELGMAVELAPFFRDMPERLAAAHLMVCRAGASTVCELTAAGRPAILVPYPHATDDHQTANARSVAAGGGAWVMPQPDFTPEALAERLRAFLAEPGTLTRAAEASRARGTVEAASRLAEAVLAAADDHPIDGRETEGPATDGPATDGHATDGLGAAPRPHTDTRESAA